MIAILDYDAGNIKSVEKAMQLLGQEVRITRDKETILSADKVILPGVGAFGDAMGKIRQARQSEFYDNYVLPLLKEAQRLGITAQELSDMLKKGETGK